MAFSRNTNIHGPTYVSSHAAYANVVLMLALVVVVLVLLVGVLQPVIITGKECISLLAII